METVNNLASAASRAIWGEGKGDNDREATNEDVSGNETKGQEPVSGQTGNVEAGEPYDKGNADEPTSTTTQNFTDENPTEGSASTATQPLTDEGAKTLTLTSNPKPTSQQDAPGNTPATDPIRPEHDIDKTVITSGTEPSDGVSDQKPTSSSDNSSPDVAGSGSSDPSSAPQNIRKHQGAELPSDEPSSDEHDRIKETKREAEEAAAVDTSGPGPKSLEEKAREGGGAIGVSEGEAKEGEDDGPQKESHGEGTGKKYVKSSGMQVDGGDFDAAKAGAGREADRLLEEKGVHHDQGAGGPAAGKEEVGGTTDSKASKPKLSEKIKAKLHIGREKD